VKNLTKQRIADCIYANRDLITDNSIDTASVETLMSLTKAQLIDIATSFGLDPEKETANPFNSLLQEQGLTTHLAKDGSAYTTLALPLESTNGILFKFTYLDGTVNVSGDIQLFRAYRDGLVSVGDKLEFNFSDENDFVLYNAGAKLYSNNSQLTNPNSPQYNPTKVSAGLLNKTVNACLFASVEKDTVAKDLLNKSIINIADKYKISIPSARKLVRETKKSAMQVEIAETLASLFK